jgi:hypothetical protein
VRAHRRARARRQDRQPDDLWASIRTIADALGIADAGVRLAADVHARLDAGAGARRRLPAPPCCWSWAQPLIVAGGGTLQGEARRDRGGPASPST